MTVIGSRMTPMSTLTDAGAVHWGVMLAQGWKGELAEAGRAESWPVAREWARQAERLGFHGIWVFDHFQFYPARDDSPVLEASTTLAALSQATEWMILGTLVSCTAYRPAMVTVKMADNVHALSGGRLCLGLGAGWDEPEFGFLGLPFPSAAERSDRLETVLRACRSSWRDLACRSGVSAADGPGRAGRPLLLIGGEGERRTLPAAAAYADAVNWQVGVDEFIRKSRVLTGLCESAGRDPACIRRTHAPNFQLFDSERDFARWRQDERRGMSAEDVHAYIRSRGALYGTVAAIEETVEQFIDAGCGGLMVFCNSAPSAHTLEQLAALPPVCRAIGGSLFSPRCPYGDVRSGRKIGCGCCPLTPVTP
jgi:alkanesulfonate monooxygenase SsuD/methylene tetrahydromethanopterin reductase-like flavin-dependent oxidoreductase (luciferase family)